MTTSADTFGHAVGQFGHDDRFGQLHVAHDLFALDLSTHRLLTRALLLALHRGHGPLTATFAAGQRLVQGQLACAAAVGSSRAFTPRVALFALAFRLARPGRGGGTVEAPPRARHRPSAGRSGRGGGLGCGLCGLGGFARLALFLFGLGLERLLALALFALLGLLLGAAAFALFSTFALFGLALRCLVGFAGLGGLQRLQAAFHFGIGNARRAAWRITQGTRSPHRSRARLAQSPSSAPRRACVWFPPRRSWCARG